MTIYRLNTKVGIDKPVDEIQTALANVSWLDNIYPRCIIQVKSEPNQKDIFFPEFWADGAEPVNVMPDDTFKAQSFCISRDPMETDQPIDFGDNQWLVSQPLSVVIWADTSRINGDAGSQRNTETLKRQLLSEIKKVPSFTFTRSFEEWSRVLEGFTMRDEFRTYIKPPYWAIRIDGLARFPVFPENC